MLQFHDPVVQFCGWFGLQLKFLVFDILLFFKHICQHINSQVFDDSVVVENNASDAFSAIVGLQKIGNKRNAYRQETDELWSHVREGSVQALQSTVDEGFVGEYVFKEIPDFLGVCFLSERWAEENVFQDVQDLNLHDVLSVGNHLFEHFKQWVQDELHDSSA